MRIDHASGFLPTPWPELITPDVFIGSLQGTHQI
jgi:hypothetical protein